MRIPRLKTLLATGLLLLMVIQPSSAFIELLIGYFFSNTASNIAERLAQPIVRPVQEVVVGGGTHIVWTALTHDYIPGLKEAIWDLIKKGVTGEGIPNYDGLLSVAAASLNLAAQIIRASVEGSVALQNQFVDSFSSMINTAVTTFGGRRKRSLPSESPLVRLLRGRRSLHSSLDDLRESFNEVSKHKHLGCAQLVLCAIHADPEELVTPKESLFRDTFRPLFNKETIPSWAKNYIEASDFGSKSASVEICQEKYQSCAYTASYLRKLINLALETRDYLMKH